MRRCVTTGILKCCFVSENQKKRFRAPSMPARSYVKENSSAVMLATRRSTGVALEVNLWERISRMPTPSANKAAHSTHFDTHRRRHKKSKTGKSVAPQKGMCPPKIL